MHRKHFRPSLSRFPFQHILTLENAEIVRINENPSIRGKYVNKQHKIVKMMSNTRNQRLILNFFKKFFTREVFHFASQVRLYGFTTFCEKIEAFD